MKKVLCLLFCLSLVTSVMAGGKIIFKSGDLSVFNTSEKAVVIFDYSKAELENKDLTLEEYIEQKGYKFAEKWERAQELAHKDFVKRFNKKSTGLKLTSAPKEVKYQFVVQVKTINLGNAAKSFLPVVTVKGEGGAILFGRIMVKDANGKDLCILRFTDIKGMGTVSVESRMLLVYQELQKTLTKFLKKNLATNPDEEEDEE